MLNLKNNIFMISYHTIYNKALKYNTNVYINDWLKIYERVSYNNFTTLKALNIYNI